MSRKQIIPEVNIVGADSHIITALSKLSGMPYEGVEQILRLNVITVQQLAMITGKTASSIESKLCFVAVDEEQPPLTSVFPFPAAKKGPKFILRDEKFDKFIISLITN